jgi:hypothetical protein
MVDADAMLTLFMAGNTPDPVRFHATVDGLIIERAKAAHRVTFGLYGDMPDVLCKRGDTAGAIGVEALWNRVATHTYVSLLCGCSVWNFYAHAAADLTSQTVCDQHHHVITAHSRFSSRPLERASSGTARQDSTFTEARLLQ